MNTVIKTVIRNAFNSVDRRLGIRAMLREDETPHPLSGDRAIEWSWIVSHLPRTASSVLDLGCVQAPLSGIAARMGHKVTAVDLREIEYQMSGVRFLRMNICEMPESRFDVIMNCSMIEHVGLPDRYGESAMPDGDLDTMARLSGFLAPGGIMLLTIPLGIDSVFVPFHRIYGKARLPELLKHYRLVEEEYWRTDGQWRQCERDAALSVVGSASAYALGLFTLTVT